MASYRAQTPLQHAAGSGRKDVVLLLLAKGADPNKKDRSGRTALHEAVRGHSKDVAELLLAKGAHPDAEDKKAMTPLALDAAGHCDAIIALLEKLPAWIRGTDRRSGALNDGWTPWEAEQP